MDCAWRNFKNNFSRPLFIIIFRTKILFSGPYSILTGHTKVESVAYQVLRKLVNSQYPLINYPFKNQDMEGNSSVAPSYPSLSDLSIADLSSFKSLTAQKLMAGLSFNSIDTLLEVNAAAEARSKLNESTETVDFGIIQSLATFPQCTLKVLN